MHSSPGVSRWRIVRHGASRSSSSCSSKQVVEVVEVEVEVEMEVEVEVEVDSKCPRAARVNHPWI